MSMWTYGGGPEQVERIKGAIDRGIAKAAALGRRQALADRDAELNRWRDPAQPDWVVYPQADGAVKALNEATLSQVHRHDPKHSYGYKKSPGNLAIIAWLDAGRPLAPTCKKCGGIVGGFDVCKCVIDAVRARRATALPDSVITDPSIVEDSPLPSSADLDHTYCVRCCPAPAIHVHSYCGVTAGDGDTIDSGTVANCPECLAFNGCPACGLGARQEPPA